jgi:protoporphyrinogen oxidase
MSNKQKSVAVISGAGPAGLTAAYELLLRAPGVKPIILELEDDYGGIARTINYKGNRMDIGGHRFFSKSDRVMQWWDKIMPLQNIGTKTTITYQGKTRDIDSGGSADPDRADLVMLVRNRLSRIFFLRRFFDYPIKLSMVTLRNLGPIRLVKIAITYTWARLFPRKPENSLEDFFINRFGRELYETFFKDYTKKVWGIPCTEIKPEWGAQRVKGLSVTSAIIHAVKSILLKGDQSIGQKSVETSLIEKFLYPKYGPGQMWREVASQVKDMGGEIFLRHQVVGIATEEKRVVSVEVKDLSNGSTRVLPCDYFFSTMPINELVGGIKGSVPEEVKRVASGLKYRDFITVGLLLDKLVIKDPSGTSGTDSKLISDNWIYVQERDVLVGRIQVFNNWSPYLVKDPSKVWLGLEYFCNEGDDLWNLSQDEMLALAKSELIKLGFIRLEDVLDGTVVRVKKTYPAYYGTYAEFDVIKNYFDSISNIFLVGRNGMHRYNNQDHSMLTSMAAVDNVISGRLDKSNIWEVNTEMEYHEEKAS